MHPFNHKFVRHSSFFFKNILPALLSSVRKNVANFTLYDAQGAAMAAMLVEVSEVSDVFTNEMSTCVFSTDVIRCAQNTLVGINKKNTKTNVF